MSNNELRQVLINADIDLNTENIIILKNKIREELNKKNTSKAI